MNAMISLKDGTLVYKNINKVRVQDLHIVVECNDNYSVNNAELLRSNNVSTKPFIHVFYDAKILCCSERSV